ncbi:MAG: single-stranded DNA-binding protein [Elusimicrobiota bacterium]|jgi:single-strand DNA-binding protein|nr:single-stranded DNA-binding protein [Elusimicrobiota bacterium]
MTTGQQIRLPEMNFILISGRLTRDADIRATQSGLTICSFDVAVNRRYLDNASGEWKDDVAYVPVTVFGPAADRVKDRLTKGAPVMVEGRLTMSEFTDKSGQARKILRVTSRKLQILQWGEGATAPRSEGAAEAAEVAEDDVPF